METHSINGTPVPYRHGLADLGDGCFAWLEPPGSWGLANSGVVAGPDDCLIVDTQNDMRLARALREEVGKVAYEGGAATIVNTHSDSDHWSGNCLFDAARIISSDETRREMTNMWLNQDRLAEASRGEGSFSRWIDWRSRTFDYAGWEPSYPSETFSGELSLEAAGHPVRLIEVGPAHTGGDVIAHLPADGIVFAGDILFTESTPMVWSGPIARCLAACEAILALDPRLVVPGHGPVVGTAGVSTMRDYLQFIDHYVTAAYQAGQHPEEAYRRLDLGPYSAWPHASRVYHTIRVGYRTLDPRAFPIDRIQALETVLSDDDGDWRRR